MTTRMRARSSRSAWVVLIATVVCTIAIAGCWGSSPRGGSGDVRVTDIILGRSLAADGTIAEDARTNSFWVNDTFYVEVVTEGAAPSATLAVHWTYQDGSAAGEATKTI